MSIESTPMESVPRVTLSMRPYEAEVTAGFEEDAQAEVAIGELKRLGATDIVLSPGDRVATGLFRAPSELVRNLDQSYAPHGNEPYWLPGERERLLELRAKAADASGRAMVGAEADRNIS